MNDWLAIILAAGAGSRMRSRRAKILHPVAGRPMVRWVVDAAMEAGIGRCLVVLGPATEAARAALPEGTDVAYQAEPRGTADAVYAAAPAAGASEQVIVLNGDVPLIRPATIRSLCEAHARSGATLTFLTATGDATGMGRVARGAAGEPLAVEERDASPELLASREFNAGIYCFRAAWLWAHLEQVAPSAATGELYLTSLVQIAVSEGEQVQTTAAEAEEVQGVNARAELARAEAVARERIRSRLLDEGVTLIDPPSTFVDAGVRVGFDTVIYPNTTISGDSEIGEACEIGPNTIIRSSRIGAGCRVLASVIEEALVEEEVAIGPFSHLRPGASIGRGVELGNYAEVKQSRVGPGTLMHHFGYIGDATVGAGVNIGAGTITCNFDGTEKHRTTIGDGAFVGSDTMLVAPVSLGEQARTGAGTVVIRDVPAGTLVAGVPARVLRGPAPAVPPALSSQPSANNDVC